LGTAVGRKQEPNASNSTKIIDKLTTKILKYFRLSQKPQVPSPAPANLTIFNLQYCLSI
jgi:hypothetical protein